MSWRLRCSPTADQASTLHARTPRVSFGQCPLQFGMHVSEWLLSKEGNFAWKHLLLTIGSIGAGIRSPKNGL